LRPAVRRGATFRYLTGCGYIYVTINENENGEPCEVFVRLGKAGGCASCQTSALGKTIARALQAGVKAEVIVSDLKGMSCGRPAGIGDDLILSCPDAIARALSEYIPLQTPLDEKGTG